MKNPIFFLFLFISTQCIAQHKDSVIYTPYNIFHEIYDSINRLIKFDTVKARLEIDNEGNVCIPVYVNGYVVKKISKNTNYYQNYAYSYDSESVYEYLDSNKKHTDDYVWSYRLKEWVIKPGVSWNAINTSNY